MSEPKVSASEHKAQVANIRASNSSAKEVQATMSRASEEYKKNNIKIGKK